MNYEIQGHTYRCTATDRTLGEGEVYYSVLRLEHGKLVRLDYSQEAWNGPPAGIFGFWKGRVPTGTPKQSEQTDPATLLELFEQFHQTANASNKALQHLLALMLLRRKVFKLMEVEEQAGRQVWILHCPRNDTRYAVPDPGLSAEELARQQEGLAELLAK